MSYLTQLKTKMNDNLVISKCNNNLRSLIAMKAGLPLIRKLDVIPDRHLETLSRKYGYEIQSIKKAIMHDEWC